MQEESNPRYHSSYMLYLNLAEPMLPKVVLVYFLQALIICFSLMLYFFFFFLLYFSYTLVEKGGRIKIALVIYLKLLVWLCGQAQKHPMLKSAPKFLISLRLNSYFLSRLTPFWSHKKISSLFHIHTSFLFIMHVSRLHFCVWRL